MNEFIRFWRVGADDYEEPTSRRDDVDGRQRSAKRAELRLRDAIESGERPDVVLVAPEQATRTDSASLGPVFAWTADGETFGRTVHTPNAPVRAVLRSDTFEPDPVSADFATGGSVLLHDAALVRLDVAPWLGPVADKLRDRYGCPVVVEAGEVATSPLKVPEMPLCVLSGPTLDDETIGRLVEHFEAMNAADVDGVRKNGTRLAVAPPWIMPACLESAQALGAAFDLPVDWIQAAVVGYGPGTETIWHRDRGVAEPFTADRTVSFSISLSDPSEYEGGLFVGPDRRTVAAGKGAFIGFTASTFHAVQRVTSGRRLVLIAFGYRR